jgi:enamine deaminase RidA (YjgF/YER057c/UK114 family)
MTVERLGSGGPYEEIYGYSRVVRVGPFALTAGCTAPGDGAAVQARAAFGIALSALAKVGADLTDVVRTRMYVTPAADADAVGRVHGEIFGSVRPVATLVVVAGLIHPDLLVEVEVEAYVR